MLLVILSQIYFCTFLKKNNGQHWPKAVLWKLHFWVSSHWPWCLKWISPKVSASYKVNSTKIWVSEQFASLIYLLNMKESENHSVVSDSLTPHGLFSPWNCAGQNIGGGSLSLLEGIFRTQGSNSGLPYCRWILYLSHKGSSLSK